MADTHRIHLARSPQDQASTPQPLDPVDIVNEVMTTVRDCRIALAECEDYQAMILRELASRLNHLEVVVLRTVAAKSLRRGAEKTERRNEWVERR